jgi:hypothetical protein
MCLNVVGLVLGMIGAVGLSLSNLRLSPFQIRDGDAGAIPDIDKLYKCVSVISTLLIAIGFALQLAAAC